MLLLRGVWVELNGPSPDRLGAPTFSTPDEMASRQTTNCEDPNVSSLTLDSGSEIEPPGLKRISRPCKLPIGIPQGPRAMTEITIEFRPHLIIAASAVTTASMPAFKAVMKSYARRPGSPC